MPDKEAFSCFTCNVPVRKDSAAVCARYEELGGKVYCPTHRNELLTDYLCVECGSLVRPEVKKVSEEQYGKVYCPNCQKKGLARSVEKVETALAVVQPIVAPAVTPKDAVSAWTGFLALKQSIKSDADVEMLTIGGKPKEYLKKSFWRKMATFFNLSDRIVTKEIATDDNEQIISAYYEVEVRAPNGRTAIGVGFCEISERQSGRDSFAHPGHDVRGTAHTRAKNRAISDMIAGGEVTFEEMVG